MNNWQVAYSAIAEVAATLSGLLFVSLSIKINSAPGNEREEMLSIARRSFMDFLAVLSLALFFLVPTISLQSVGLVAIVLGIARATWHVNHWIKYRSGPAATLHTNEFLKSIFATTFLLVAGVGSLLAWVHAPRLIYAAAIVLLFGACKNAWLLLVR
jgi:hypothetical protein